jgi:hypothetical protein
MHACMHVNQCIIMHVNNALVIQAHHQFMNSKSMCFFINACAVTTSTNLTHELYMNHVWNMFTAFSCASIVLTVM